MLSQAGGNAVTTCGTMRGYIFILFKCLLSLFTLYITAVMTGLVDLILFKEQVLVSVERATLTAQLASVQRSNLPQPEALPYTVQYFEEHNISAYGANDSFFVYSPSGGLNNQRMEMEYALHISKLLKRTLLIPMLAPHTSLWQNYRKVGLADLCPVDYIFDLAYLQSYGPRVMPLKCTIDSLEQVLEQLPKEDATIVYHRERKRDWHAAEVRAVLRPIRSKVLFLKGPTMFHNWFPPYIVSAVRVKSRYTKEVRKLALRLMRASLPPVFNALHLRLGDKGDRGLTGTTLVESMTMRNFSYDVPVYVATEPRDIAKHPELFGPLESKWDVVYARDLVPREHVEQFRGLFSKRLQDDMFGVIEQLICTAANKFKGSTYSRFTQFIGFMRHHKEELFPELVEGQNSSFDVHNDSNPRND